MIRSSKVLLVGLDSFVEATDRSVEWHSVLVFETWLTAVSPSPKNFAAVADRFVELQKVDVFEVVKEMDVPPRAIFDLKISDLKIFDLKFDHSVGR